MNEVFQDIKIVCQNSIIKGSVGAEGHPWRNWKIRLIAVDDKKERRGKLEHLLERVEYLLHPTFENPSRVFLKEPYLLQERGWGEFDMRVVLYFKNNLANPENIYFDLHFRESAYAIPHRVVFPVPVPPELIRLVSLEFPVSDTLLNGGHTKKRRTSPSALVSSKKIRTPPIGNNQPPALSDSKQHLHQLHHQQQQQQQQQQQHHHHQHNQHNQNRHNNNNNLLTSYYPIQQKINSIEGDLLEDMFHGTYGTKREGENGQVIDDIYSEQDIERVNPIHTQMADQEVRKAWGIPEGLDILELARRLSFRTPEQTEEIETMIKKQVKDNSSLEETEDEFVFDLYSLGPKLLNQLWEYTERSMSPSMFTATTTLSPFSLVQANAALNEQL
ncbi:yeats-domain-containing protein [Backusella circina FSU 941]|nr:yeats-domain-containing protein [Backusella circina FSU 941]